MELQLLQYDKNFSKKPIVQLEVVEDYKLLFSLSDNLLSVNDISRHNFPIIHLAAKTKGATAFAMNVQKTQSLTGELSLLRNFWNFINIKSNFSDQITLVLRVCVVVKRKLQLYYWKKDELKVYAPDIDLIDVPKVVAWTGNLICVGYRSEYVLYDVS